MQDENNPNSLLGRFWLPHQDEASAVPGIMDLGDFGGAVRLDGCLTEYGLLANAIVFARLQGGYEKATLFNCFASVTSRSNRKSSKLSSTLVALGVLRENLGGHAIQFQLPGSAAWFNERCIDVSIGDASEVVMRFKAFESTRYPLPNDAVLEKYYAARLPLPVFGGERFAIYRPMSFRISSASRLEFKSLMEQVYRLRRLFELLTQHHLPSSYLALYEDTNIEDGQPDIEIRHSSLGRVKAKDFDWEEQLVLFNDIRDRFPELLCRWFEIYEVSLEPFERYFAAFDRNRADPILHFLWNVAALEELHKLRTSRVTKEEFTLLSRLQDICARWAAAISNPVSDQVLSQIKDSRHYYAHAASDLRDKAAKGFLLLRYGDFLAALSSLEMLALLGFKDEEAISLTNRFWMQQALALTRYPEDFCFS